MLKARNVFRSLFLIDCNQEIASVVFRHWFTWVWARMLLMILPSSALLTFPSWLLQGLIRRRFGWFSRSGMWSFKDTKAGVLFTGSMRLEMLSLSAMFMSSLLISFMVLSFACLYVFVTFSVTSLLYVEASISKRFIV